MVEEIAVRKEACTACGTCVSVCPVGAIALVDRVASIDESRCTRCGACVDACPQGALVAVETLPAAATPFVGEIVQTGAAPTALASRTSRVLPALGGALVFVAQEVLPRLVPRLWDALQPQGGQTAEGGRLAGKGWRFRRRERGRRGRP